MQNPLPQRVLALIPAGIALNLLLGTLAHTIKLPVYLDAIGTIVVTIVGGLLAGVITGVGSFLIGGILTNPVLPWFSGTQAAIAIFVALAAYQGWLKSWPRTILSGIGLGIVAGIVSAPVIVALFGGITGSGASLIVAFLLASGESILKSVVLSGLAAEPLDKALQLSIAVSILRKTPQSVLRSYANRFLYRNCFLDRDYAISRPEQSL
jgi:energy-coupling factor transport system substrate-specific component